MNTEDIDFQYLVEATSFEGLLERMGEKSLINGYKIADNLHHNGKQYPVYNISVKTDDDPDEVSNIIGIVCKETGIKRLLHIFMSDIKF